MQMNEGKRVCSSEANEDVDERSEEHIEAGRAAGVGKWQPLVIRYRGTVASSGAGTGNWLSSHPI